MFAAFFAAGVALGEPRRLLSFPSSLNTSLTHHATGTALIIFGAGYTTFNEGDRWFRDERDQLFDHGRCRGHLVADAR